MDICIPIITRFDRLMFVFKDLEANIMRFNSEFELQLTIGDCVEDEGKRIPTLMSVNQFSMIEVLGNTTKKKEVKLDNPLFHSISVLSRPCHSIPITYCTTYPPTK